MGPRRRGHRLYRRRARYYRFEGGRTRADDVNETLERRIEDRTRQLAASEALIHTFFNHSSECHAVIVEESDGRFRYAEVNPATLRLYRKTREEVIGQTIEPVLGAERATEIGAQLAASLHAGAPHRYERTRATSDRGRCYAWRRKSLPRFAASLSPPTT
jgi:PAS domain-containing protein